MPEEKYLSGIEESDSPIHGNGLAWDIRLISQIPCKSTEYTLTTLRDSLCTFAINIFLIHLLFEFCSLVAKMGVLTSIL